MQDCCGLSNCEDQMTALFPGLLESGFKEDLCPGLGCLSQVSVLMGNVSFLPLCFLCAYSTFAVYGEFVLFRARESYGGRIMGPHESYGLFSYVANTFLLSQSWQIA